MEKKLKKYLLKKYYGGKSEFAVITDKILFALLLATSVFVIFFLNGKSLTASIIIAVLSAAAFYAVLVLIRKKRLERFAQKELAAAEDEYILEAFILSGKKRRRGLLKEAAEKLAASDGKACASQRTMDFCGGFIINDSFCFAFDNHPKYSVNIEQVTKACRAFIKSGAENLILISTSDFDDDAVAMGMRLGKKFTVSDKKSTLKLLGESELSPSRKELCDYLLSEIEAKRMTPDKMRSAFLNPDKTRFFALSAAVFSVWQFIFGFRIAFTVPAAVCTALAVISYFSRSSH